MLRGQVALHQDRPGEAIQHLEQAVRLVPESVAARAMLVRAMQNEGRWDEGVMMLDELSALTPKSAEDHLFLGWARAAVVPHRGLEALNEAVRMRPGSPIARVIRADVRSLHASDTADPTDVEAALEDARTAKGMLPDSPLALQVHLTAHLVAAGVYEGRQEPGKRMEALAEAERDARALERFTGLPGVHWTRATYFEEMGTQYDVHTEWRRAYQSEHPFDDAFWQYALALYRRGEHDQAISVMDRLLAERGGGGEGELVRAYLPMFMARPDARESALATYHKAIERSDSSMFMLWHQTILRLSGDERAAMEACPTLDERFSRLPDWVLEWYQRPLNYNCDRISKEELLAAAGNSHWRQCEANFFIGIRRLGDGDRAGATEHFRRSVRTGVFYFLEYRWSRRFLVRLEEDPAWPPWIPQK
jgi:tetratricopeptide (TPR) repeat protein